MHNAIQCKDVQTKWKSLRDRHIRYMRENRTPKSGSAAKSKKTYIYAKHLDFLRSNMAHNITEDSQCDQTEPVDGAQTASGNDVEGTPPSTSTQYRRKMANLEDKLEKYMDSVSRREAVMQREEDEDLAFFRSLLSTVKRLPVGEKLQFQSDVLHLLITYNNKIQNQPELPYRPQHNYGPQHYQGPYQSNFQLSQPGSFKRTHYI
nr:unnamed protein product [Callosobruchus chinensis]